MPGGRTVRVALVLLLVGCAHTQRVEEVGPTIELSLYPVPGLSVAAEETRALVQPAFRARLDATELGYFHDRFTLPSAVATIDDANKRRTLAASVQLGRASFFVAPKPGSAAIDVYVPVTASLYLTNVLTGEVQYAHTVTHVETQTLPAALARADSDEVGALFLAGYHGAVDELLASLPTRFNPSATCGVVRRAWHGLAVLDAGTARGLADDDAITDDAGNELRVVYASDGYAVARTELGRFDVDARFCRSSARTVADARKPSVLVVVEQAPAWMPAETLAQLATDLLGDKTAVRLVPINQTYTYVRQALAQSVALGQAQLHRRALPELFLRLSALEPLTYETPTVLPHKQLRITEATVLAELVDHAGRVVFASRGHDRVQDEIVLGTVIDLEGRREIAVKNALLDLATRMGKELRFRSATLPLRVDGTRLRVEDPDGVLQASARVFHALGHVSGIAGDVWVLTWELAISGAQDGLADAATTLPVAKDVPAPSRGDRVIVSSAGLSQAGRHRLAACGSSERLGAIEVPSFEALALNAFASATRAPYFVRGLGERVARTLRADASFAAPLAMPDAAIDLCVEPAQRIDPLPPVCNDEDVCVDRAQVGIALRLHAGATAAAAIAARPGLKTTVRARALRVGTTAEARGTALAADLTEEVLKLGAQLAPEVDRQAL